VGAIFLAEFDKCRDRDARRSGAVAEVNAEVREQSGERLHGTKREDLERESSFTITQTGKGERGVK